MLPWYPVWLLSCVGYTVLNSLGIFLAGRQVVIGMFVHESSVGQGCQGNKQRNPCTVNSMSYHGVLSQYKHTWYALPTAPSLLSLDPRVWSPYSMCISDAVIAHEYPNVHVSQTTSVGAEFLLGIRHTVRVASNLSQVIDKTQNSP